MLNTAAVGGKALVLSELRLVDYLAEAPELLVITDRHDHMSIGRGKGLVGHDVGVCITQTLGHLARRQVVQRLIGQHAHLHIHECQIDMAAFATVAALVEGRQHRVGRIQAGKNIGNGDPHLDRAAP